MNRQPASWKLLLAGFGNVGQELASILVAGPARYPRLGSLDVRVVGITTGRHGGLANPDGLDLAGALGSFRGNGAFKDGDPDFFSGNTEQAIRELDYDVLLELSPLNIEGRGEPAVSFIKAALSRKRHVVTANKGPIAFRYHQLMELAQQNGVALRFESTVMDGAPVFSLVEFGLRGCTIQNLTGILNSTTNFVLQQMSLGSSTAAAIAEAQRLGFAERDPSYDLDGWDAAAKACVLANVLMGAEFTPDRVRRTPGLPTEGELAAAEKAGVVYRQVARAWRTSDQIEVEVVMKGLPKSDPLAAVQGNGGFLCIETDLTGPICIWQIAPPLSETAYGVLNDLLLLPEKS